jgi:uncharacterized protein (TIGR03545 family)
MRHAIRWQVFVPRILLVAVALLAAKYAMSRLARSVAVSSLQSAVDAPVEAKYANLSLLSRQFVLGDLRFRTPGKSQHTVLQIDRCALDIGARGLLYKQAVVERGLLTGVKFDLPLPAVGTHGSTGAPLDATEQAASVRWTSNTSAERFCQWLATLDERFEKELVSQFGSVARSHELYARWPKQASELESRIHELKRRATALKTEIAAAQLNPLRNMDFFSRLPEEIATLRGEFNRAHAELERLAQSVDAGRRTIVRARRDDEELVRKELHVDPVDVESLSAYLLREQMRGPLNQVIAVLRWIRQEVPAHSVATRRRTRGEDVLFAGCRPAPGLLVNKLLLQGTARIGGLPFELRGTLSDFTDAPSLHSSPIRLRMRSNGTVPVELRVTMDRSAAVARDELLIDCKEIALPELFFGRANEFHVALAPCVGTLTVCAIVEGEKLCGDVQLVQKRVQVTPLLTGRLSDVPIAAALQETLAGVDHVALQVTLSGTLSEPCGTLSSNLGSAVAEALQTAVRRAANLRAQTLLASAQRGTDEQLATLDRLAHSHKAALQSLMSTATKELQRIAGEHAAGGRISHEQLGRRLPAGSILR